MTKYNYNSLCTENIGIFSTLAVSEIEEIIKLSKEKKYLKDNFVFKEDEDIKNIIIIKEGEIRLSKFSSDGYEYIIKTLKKGDIYGEENLFIDSRYNINGIANNNLTIDIIDIKDIEKMIKSNAELGIKIIKTINYKLYDINRKFEILSRKDDLIRISGLILYLNEKNNTDIIEISREDIACHLNLKKEIVLRKLIELEQEGLVKLIGHKKIQIIDKNRLELLYRLKI